MTSAREKVMLVTGGSRGIGAATARLAGRNGYTVAVNYRSDRAAAEQVVREIEADGGRAAAFEADVSVAEDIWALFDAVDRTFGSLTALVNNAGFTGKASPLVEADADAIRRIINLNVTGLMLCAQDAVRRMSTARGGKGGAIVNISSGAATLGSPGEYVWYAASKGAVDSFTIGLGKEVAAEGIRVNAVAPGMVETDIHAAAGMPDRMDRIAPSIPMQRGADPDEIAQAILFLLSDDASYVTGTVLRVAGGR